MSEIEVKFGFDPYKSEALKVIVKDPIAMSLWALWKRNHLVSDVFIGDVQMVSHMVQLRRPKTVESLRVCFPAQTHDFTASDVKRFCPEWLDVLSGATKLYFVIGGKRVHLAI